MPDQELVCRDCGAVFVFTVDEQRFFAERGYTNAPSRCLKCRRERRESGGQARGGGGRPGRVMTDVTCSSCGKPTQVPFVPSADRPVYCADCYRLQAPRGQSLGRRY